MKQRGILLVYKALPGLFLLLFPLFSLAQLPSAGFTQNKPEGCLPLIIDFSDNSAGTITSYLWDFGNGNTSVLQNPSVLYSKAGTYTVKLYVTDASGNKDSLVKTNAVTVFPNPKASFTATPATGCQGVNVIFTDGSTPTVNPIISWAWNFGDGQVSTQQSPPHVYTTEGTYAVSLIVIDTKGCKDILNQTNLIKIGKPPAVSFTADNKTGCLLPHTVNFTNTTPQEPGKTYTYAWDFGDGNTSTGQNPSHIYSANGKFTVGLTVTDNTGCSQNYSANGLISIGKTVADFDALKKSGCAPMPVNFKNYSQNVPPDAKQVWLMGNGDSVTGAEPVYTYNTAGKYTVTLKITSPGGCTDTRTITDFVTVVPPPTVDFTSNDSVSCVLNQNFNFQGKATGVTKWDWDFGDGATSAQQNPVKNYSNRGTYTVSLTVTFGNGCTVTKTKKDFIKNKTQKSEFTVSDTSGCAPLEIQFTDKSTSGLGIKTREWDFGDGQKSTATNPLIIFTKPGTYRVRLTITDSAGCKDESHFDSIYVGIKANPDFVADKKEGCKQDMNPVKFTNLTPNYPFPVDMFRWIIAGTTIDKNDRSDVSHYFKDHQFATLPDSVDVMLITYSNGCADTIEKKNYIILFPPDVKVDYTIDNCRPDTVTFTNNSFGADVFEWWFNGQKINDTHSFKRFLAPGVHTLIAKAQNLANNCKDERTYFIEVLDPLRININQSKSVICANDSISFSLGSTRIIKSVEWKINGTVYATTDVFTHTFKNYGSYDVTLTVEDIFGCKKDTTITGAVKVQAPDATPVVTPDKGCFPINARLIVTGASAGSFKYARWIVGNDTVITAKDTLPYIFDEIIAGMNITGISVSLKVEDASGCAIEKQTTVQMSYITSKIATNVLTFCTSTEFSFYNDLAPMPVGFLSHRWLLDDNIVYNTAAAKHTVTQSGVHKLKLVITDNGLRCSDSSETTVNIKVKKITAGFTADKTHIACPPLVTTFTDASKVENTSINQVRWWFGDGSSSIIPSPVKNYFFPGNYSVSYKVWDSWGCSDSITLPGKVFVGGPKGEYHLDRYEGCVPFEVNFSVQNKLAKTVQWDFGDGVLAAGEKVKNQYTRPGVYNPAMILEDTAGCVVVYPTKKPVIGYASPMPDFTANGKCIYDEFFFASQTDTMGQPTTYVWKFGNGDTATGSSTYYKYQQAGKYDTELKATSINGCSASIIKPVIIKDLQANFTVNGTAFCREDVVMAFDKSTADAGIKEWTWWLGDGRSLFVQNPSFVYTVPGEYKLSLVITDNDGCRDSLSGPDDLAVFDTLPPPAPFAYRVTVEEDNTLRFEYSPYTQKDFGRYIIYRAPAGQPLQVYKEITNRADTIYTDKSVNPDNSSYTYKVISQSFCDKFSAWGQSAEHTSILLQGTSDTNTVQLKWSRYGGWDKVKTYHIYRREPSQQAFAKVGAVPGTDTLFNDTSTYCSYLYRYYVVAEQDAANPLFSRSNTVAVAPFHKPTVLPGSIIRATVEDDKNILIEFGPPAKQIMPIVLYTLEKSANGKDYSKVHTTKICCEPYLDEKTDVHARSYYYHIRTTDYCGDVSDPGNLGKSILLKTLVNNEDNIKVDWSAYQHWADGVKLYELELMDANGNFVKAATNNFTDTSYTDVTGNYNQMAQVCYRVKAVSNTGIISYSNTDCEKGRSSIFAPNAFTPNTDAFNGLYIVVGSFIKTYELNIFNRYGEKLFTSYSLDHSWDGTFKGKQVQDDAYLYVINALGMDGKWHNLNGTVTVLH